MIDIHPPGHAPMTHREFFTHLFIIILGIIIAIGLEQSVEATVPPIHQPYGQGEVNIGKTTAKAGHWG